MQTNRRQFAAALTAASYSRVLGANDRVNLAGLGVGGRGSYLLETAKKLGAEIVAVADVNSVRRDQARTRIAPGAREYGDYRQALELKDADAVVVGAPDHWHVAMTIDAVGAGKDVYVEKPLTHAVEEGPRVEKAVAASKRIVQVGYQQRSWDLFQQAREVIVSGRLGRITLVLSSWYQNYVRMTATPPQVDAAQVDWKGFLGTAPLQPFDPMRYTFWRWYWDFGGGHLTDLHSHWGDVINWYLGVDVPVSVQGMGERSAIPKFECPDTVSAAWNYPRGLVVTYNGTIAGSLDGGNLLFRGTQGMMKLNRTGFQVWPENVATWGAERYPEPEMNVQATADGTIAHMRNFLDCVRSRQAPNAPVQAGISAARAAHYGNLAIRRGQRLHLA